MRFILLSLSALSYCSGYSTNEQLDAKFLTQTAPFIDTVLASQYNALLVSYNEKVDAATAAQKANYRIVNTSGIALAVASVTPFDGGGISFQLTTAPQTPNAEYMLSASDVQNLKGIRTNSQVSRKFLGYNTGGGVYQDNSNGTVYFSGRNITWAKCSQDNTGTATLYNSGSNNCTGGSGTVGTFAYCPAFNDSCNGNVAGQNLDGGGVSPVYSTCNALNAGAGFAGRTSWRVPTFAELSSIVTVNVNPAIDSALFPGTASSEYWSSTSYSASQAWQIHFASGQNTPSIKTTLYRVRCVSSGS